MNENYYHQPITELRVGQRVTVSHYGGTGTIVRMLASGLVGVNWDDHPIDDVGLYLSHNVQALVPDNVDGYFDWPPGYVDAG